MTYKRGNIPWMKGKHPSKETLKKMSLASKGENNSNYGKHRSEETKQKISKANKGKQIGEKHFNYGKHLSEETRNKISESNKGHKVSEETREKLRIAGTGKHPSIGTRVKQSYIQMKIRGGSGRRDKKGYIYIFIRPDNKYHSMIGKGRGCNFIAEHRLVMAKYLGRCLESWEVVHHKNRIKNDNRIENLELGMQKEHNDFHIENRLLKKEIKELRKLLLIATLLK